MQEVFEFLNMWVLTIVIFSPFVGAFFILLIPPKQINAIRVVSAIFTLIPLVCSAYLYVVFDRTYPGFQFEQKFLWIPEFKIYYHVGVDGISIPMVILTSLIGFICVFASWHMPQWPISRGMKGYFALLLILDGAMLGVFCALDLIIFYIFWELVLLPMYFLIGIWGGPRREYAAIKFFLYTLVGSVLMLVVILAWFFSSSPQTFSIPELMSQRHSFIGIWWKIAFIALFINFAIKIPAVPFHTWLPDAHVEAPTPISVILAGILLKMGTYGLMRLNYPILPEATRWFAPVMMIMGVVNIIYGALCAMAQIRGVPRYDPKFGHYIERDWKKLIANSSVSHMGYCMIGMAACTPAGMHGALFQMWNHGLITGMLFLIVGVIYDRLHHRDIAGFGGLWSKMPVYGSLAALACFASLGLPGLAGFVSEILCFIGAFQAADVGAFYLGFINGAYYYRVLTAISVLGVVLGATYLLWSYQKIFLGPLNPKYEDPHYANLLRDVDSREMFTLIVPTILIVILGIYPRPVLDLMSSSLNYLVVEMVKMPWIP
jgi:NADH-quinone oxidoreductase subunit M